MPGDWGVTTESFTNYWSQTLGSEEYVLDYLGGYTGFQLNTSFVIEAFDEVAHWYHSWTGEGGENYDPENPPISFEAAAEQLEAIDTWDTNIGQLEGAYTGQYAPTYWSDYFSITDEDIVMDAQEMMDAFLEEDWITLYGPWIANLGIDIDEWMEVYGMYLTPPDVQILSDIEETGASLKEEAYAEIGQTLDVERMNMVKTGFQTSYQSTENLNAIIGDFDTLISTIDNQTEQGMQQYAEEFYNDWLSLNQSLAQDGAFTAGCINPEADNYDPNAQFSDGSCYTTEEEDWDQGAYDLCGNFPDLLGCSGGDFDPNDPSSGFDLELAWADFCQNYVEDYPDLAGYCED